MKPKDKTPHLKIKTDSGGFICENCGAELEIKLPAMLNDYIDTMNLFRKNHAGCKPKSPEKL